MEKEMKEQARKQQWAAYVVLLLIDLALVFAFLAEYNGKSSLSYVGIFCPLNLIILPFVYDAIFKSKILISWFVFNTGLMLVWGYLIYLGLR